jgi:peptide/nickel transport system permease protein
MTDLTLQTHELSAALSPTLPLRDDLVAIDSTSPEALDQHHRTRRPALLRGRGLVGLVLVGLVVLAGALAPVLAPYNPQAQLANANLLGPSWQHLLGTDEVDRDVLSRVLFGIRTDALIVLLVVPLGAVIGGLVGIVAS